MSLRPTDEITWRVGRRCDGGACVAVAILREAVLVRDSADPCVTLSVDHARWREFLARTRSGKIGQR